MNRPKRNLIVFCSIVVILLFVAVATEAGTVINTNLPAGTSIVNIDARADGCGNYSAPNPPQPFWYQPTPTAPSLTLLPGTYTFRVVDPTDAAAIYPSLTAGQLSQIYTAWTYNSPWIENYMVFKSTAVANGSESQIFDGADTTPGLTNTSSASAAYNSIKVAGYLNKIRPAPPGRAGQTAADFVTSWTFAVPTTILFTIPDTILSDNTGGVSVVVSGVPEPSTLLLAIGAVALLLPRPHKRQD